MRLICNGKAILCSFLFPVIGFTSYNSKQLQYGWENGDQWVPAECVFRFDKIKTNGIRFVFDSVRVCPCINNVSAY